MNQDKQALPNATDPVESASTAKVKKTPAADMQGEDAGTADSGNEGSGPAAESVMKQTSKTGKESGNKR